MPFIGKNPTAGFATIVKDDFTPNGSTTVFTLSKQVATANDIAVFVGNVRQEPTDAYTVSGTTLTMSAAPATGINFYVLHIAGTIESSVVPPDGSIGTAKLVNNAVTSAKLDTNIAITGDLTVDTNTLHVDSANNKVGLGIDPGTLPSFVNHAALVSNGGGISVTSASAGDNRYIFFGNGTSSSDIQLAAIQNTNSDLIFKGASGSEKMRILNAGGITFNGDTAAANALDDYEEGTYTPSLYSNGATFSYSVQLGSYVKIGSLVYLQFNITLSGVSGTTTNTVFVDNIPFNTKNVDNSLYSGGHIGHYFNVNLSAGTTMVYQLPAVSTNQIELKESGDNMGENSIVASELQGGSVIRGSIMYRSV